MASRNCQGRRLDWAICQSEQVADLTDPWAKLLFTWLIPNADNCGRLEGEPYQIAGIVFPLEMEKGAVTVAKVERWLTELASAGLIIWYRSGRLRYIQLPKFLDHQRLVGNMKETSDYPGPEDADVQAWEDLELAYEQRSYNVSTEAKDKAKDKDSISSRFELEFSTFWSLYPRREGRGAAKKSFIAAAKKTKPETILAGLQAQLPALNSREHKYIPMPATWLNQERWGDEPGETVSELDLVLQKNLNPRRER